MGGKIRDSVWLVQEHHGMRNVSTEVPPTSSSGDAVTLPVQTTQVEQYDVTPPALPAVSEMDDVETEGSVATQDVARPVCSHGTSAKCAPRVVEGAVLHEEARQFEAALAANGVWQATRDFASGQFSKEV